MQKADVQTDARLRLLARTSHGAGQEVCRFFGTAQSDAVADEPSPALVVAGVAHHLLLEQFHRARDIAEHILTQRSETTLNLGEPRRARESQLPGEHRDLVVRAPEARV